MNAFSIVLPTADRADFVERLLSYYRSQSLKERILVADSSGPEQAGRMKSLVASFASDLLIELQSYPADLDIIRKLHDVLGLVQTKLVVVGADDDFFTLAGLKQAAEF